MEKEPKFRAEVISAQKRKSFVILMLSRGDLRQAIDVEGEKSLNIFDMSSGVGEMMKGMTNTLQRMQTEANPALLVFGADIIKLVLTTEEYKSLGSPHIGSKIEVALNAVEEAAH